MSQTDKLNAMMDAHAAYERAGKALCAATATALPVGTVVVATLGRARIKGRVVSVSDIYWHDPGTVTIENLKTGKWRRIAPWSECHDLCVISERGSESATNVPAVGQDAEAK